MTAGAREAVAGARRLLEAAGVEDAAFDALQLYLAAAGLGRTEYLLRAEQPPASEALARYGRLVERRCAGEPLQYLLGRWDFLDGSFAVGEGVLIPRPETETLALLCIETVRENGLRTVWDLCAGSGCIGISIANACPETAVWLFEYYDAALGYLRRNVPPALENRVRIVRRDVFGGPAPGLPAPGLLVSNPPYVPAGELPGLQREVRYEPETALNGGADGLDFYRCFARAWIPALQPGGFAAFECGEGQPQAVAAMLRDMDMRILPDQFGTPRFVLAQNRKERVSLC